MIQVYVITPQAECNKCDSMGVITSLFYTQHNTVTVLIVLIKEFYHKCALCQTSKELLCTGVLYQIYCTASFFEVMK